jgi:hypothetical protein
MGTICRTYKEARELPRLISTSDFPHPAITMDPETQNNEKQPSPETTQVTKEEEVIDFDGENDPTNPQNWSSLYKWSIVITISLLSLEASVEKAQIIRSISLTSAVTLAC